MRIPRKQLLSRGEPLPERDHRGHQVREVIYSLQYSYVDYEGRKYILDFADGHCLVCEQDMSSSSGKGFVEEWYEFSHHISYFNQYRYYDDTKPQVLCTKCGKKLVQRYGVKTCIDYEEVVDD